MEEKARIPKKEEKIEQKKEDTKSLVVKILNILLIQSWIESIKILVIYNCATTGIYSVYFRFSSKNPNVRQLQKTMKFG